MYLILDERGNLLDLQQQSTISSEPNELPYHVIDVATTQHGYWHDEDTQNFWERWVMNPVLTDATHDEALASARSLMQRHVEVRFNGDSLKEGHCVRLYLKPLEESGDRPLLMELMVDRIHDTVFTKDDTDPTPP